MYIIPFRIGPDRLITAAHVTSHGRCSIAGAPAETVREDGALDVAELRSVARRQFLELNCRGFRRGRWYRAIGYAGGELRVNLPWQAAGFGDAPGKAEFLGEAYPGMSGGPVIDRDGRVTGVTLQRFPARARALASTWLCGAQ